jgi:hypothetical protein
MDEPNSQLSEEHAAQVLDRAAQIDAKRGREVSVAELRHAALEAGISGEAFELALAEIRRSRQELADQALTGLSLAPLVAEHPEFRPSSSSIVSRATVLAIGFSLGGLALLLGQTFGVGSPGEFFSLLLSLLVAIGLMLRRRRERAVLDFEVDLALLWVGVTVMLMLGGTEDADEYLAIMTLMGALVGLVGGLFVALPHAKSKSKELPEET